MPPHRVERGSRMTGFGIFAYFGYDLPLEESLRRLAAACFDTVSLFWGCLLYTSRCV